MKSPHEMTIDEVIEFAITQNHPILYQACCAFKAGHCTWEKAMQAAAVSACVSLDTISKQLVEQMMRSTMVPVSVPVGQPISVPLGPLSRRAWIGEYPRYSIVGPDGKHTPISRAQYIRAVAG